MWKIEFNKEIVAAWLDSHRENGLMKYEKPLVCPVAPFDIEITENVYKELQSIYLPHEERGGIIFCKIIKGSGTYVLQAVDVKEVPNVYEPYEKDPGGSKANRYRPNANVYINYLKNNFSKTQSEEILFPIHFHTHPTADNKKLMEYYNQYFHLNTSDGDQDVSKIRYVEFNSVKMRYLNAIVTGHDADYNIVFYAPDITPLDFFSTKLDRIRRKLSNFGEELSSLTEDKGKKEIIKSAVEAVGMLAIGFNMNTIDYIPMLFKEKEYFGSLNKVGSTVINIPKYIPEQKN
jgi:hypothetical protein